MSTTGKTFIVEHLDEELGPWSELEYLAIGNEAQATGNTFVLSSLAAAFQVPQDLRENQAFRAEHRGVEELYAADKTRVCLLDPAAAKDLSPGDGETFDVFLFGGILGKLETATSTAQPRLTCVLKAMTLPEVGNDPYQRRPRE